MLLAALLLIASSGDGGWEVTSKKGGITISMRARPGSDVKELLAVTIVDQPPWVVKNVVDDVVHFKDFMPYTKVSDIVEKGPFWQTTYQYLKMPFVSDRDYVIRIRDASKRLPDGRIVYKNVWTPGVGVGPPVKDGVVRLSINEGYWLLEDHEGGAKTRLTYYLYTDPGGALPAFLINAANEQAIPDLFAAVKERAKLPQYQQSPPKIAIDAEAPPAPVTPPPTSITAPK